MLGMDHGITRDVLERAAAFRAANPSEATFATALDDLHDSGVRTGSNHNITEELLIVAVGDLVRSAAFVVWLEARDARYKQGVGSWHGQTERCFIVRLDEYDADPEAWKPWLAGQEAVLYLGPAFRDGRLYGNRKAWLLPVGPDGDIYAGPSQYIGLYGWVGGTAPASGDWTYNPEAGFFAVQADGVAKPAALFPVDPNGPAGESRSAVVAEGSGNA